MVTVYIASPYTLGDTCMNIRRQIDAADELMNHGFAPYVPLLSHFHQLVHPRKYESWIVMDLEWVGRCDCVLRLDGKSEGADKEVQHASKLKKPIFYSIEQIIDFYKYLKNFNERIKY